VVPVAQLTQETSVPPKSPLRQNGQMVDPRPFIPERFDHRMLFVLEQFPLPGQV